MRASYTISHGRLDALFQYIAESNKFVPLGWFPMLIDYRTLEGGFKLNILSNKNLKKQRYFQKNGKPYIWRTSEKKNQSAHLWVTFKCFYSFHWEQDAPVYSDNKIWINVQFSIETKTQKLIKKLECNHSINFGFSCSVVCGFHSTCLYWAGGRAPFKNLVIWWTASS